MKYKLVCFDLDGTIIDETIFIWQTIHDHLCTDKNKRQQAMDDFYNNKISYSAWALHDVDMWRQAGATKKEILKALEPLKLMNGARETLAELKKKGLKLAIISGSLNIAIEKVLPEYNEIFDYVYINELFFDSDGRIGRVIPTKYDMKHKATALKEICEKENIKPDECVFIGDHHNDVDVAKMSGLSISFNSKSEELNKVCDVLIKEKDLRKILEHVK